MHVLVYVMRHNYLISTNKWRDLRQIFCEVEYTAVLRYAIILASHWHAIKSKGVCNAISSLLCIRSLYTHTYNGILLLRSLFTPASNN